MKCKNCGKDIVPIPFELKATFQGSTKPVEDNQAWVRQVMSQCYVTKTNQAFLSRFELMGDWKSVFGKKEDKKLPEHEKPTLSAWRFEFTQAELDDHWAWMKSRRDLFLELLADPSNLLPRAMSLPSADSLWECSYCLKPYKELCGVE